MRFDRTTIVMGAGASVGMIQTVLMKQYVDAYGPIPVIGSYIPAPWNQYSTLGNILIGGAAFGISQYTNFVKNSEIKDFLSIYGITAIVGGVMNGMFPGAAPAPIARAPVRLAPTRIIPKAAPAPAPRIPTAGSSRILA